MSQPVFILFVWFGTECHLRTQAFTIDVTFASAATIVFAILVEPIAYSAPRIGRLEG